MAMTVNNMTFDCSDAPALARFWAALTGWVVFYDDDPEVMVAPHFPPTGPTMLFIPVPEGKTAKNRLHLDLQPSDRTRDAAVDQALSLGATVIGDFRKEDGSGWVAMADPEGNEFCIERSHSERPVPEGVRAYRIGS
ncbi:VOC family protein [Nocardioides bizhenqiangii]|uniref:VOC family protein n=1 Tax=Nocardioides bizhenqiangii TaxID=3095076 RepID=A0ABZ0ZUH9_9ACTN|nr:MULTISPECIES: VOC family protein [unclassified Nocardioides]MDZ5621837.1 VOC family protein [Nocardioides sp. HM23]WQQ27479.1 VOC family protein [Nocardioides sp. HM61]